MTRGVATRIVAKLPLDFWDNNAINLARYTKTRFQSKETVSLSDDEGDVQGKLLHDTLCVFAW